ncbi:MAG: hypothetical protein J6A77_09880 [Lachnospiraceae bacterium]|nr:hypothetical protein [Lachnospiraceae bacterium]
MPFIDAKITLPVSQENRDVIKTELGKAIADLNKPESYLMIGIEDKYDLYMGGKKMEQGAYVSVSLFGNASSTAYNKMTGKICRIFEIVLGIPASCVYVTYHGVSDWGWNGQNF